MLQSSTAEWLHWVYFLATLANYELEYGCEPTTGQKRYVQQKETFNITFHLRNALTLKEVCR